MKSDQQWEETTNMTFLVNYTKNCIDGILLKIENKSRFPNCPAETFFNMKKENSYRNQLIPLNFESEYRIQGLCMDF